MKTLAIALVLVSILATGNGFRNGEAIRSAPQYCGRRPQDRLPNHVSNGCSGGGSCSVREDAAPYRMEVVTDGNTYWDNDILILIESQGSQWSITGFTVSALNENDDIVGEWASDNNYVQFSCGSVSEGNTAVHETYDNRRRTLRVRWAPGGRDHGRVTFRAVVVHNVETFWAITSDVTLFPAKSGEQQYINIKQELVDVVNTARPRMGLSNMPSMDTFEDSFQNRLQSGWDPQNIFGAFNRDLTLEDFFLDEERKTSFQTSFTNSLRRSDSSPPISPPRSPPTSPPRSPPTSPPRSLPTIPPRNLPTIPPRNLQTIPPRNLPTIPPRSPPTTPPRRPPTTPPTNVFNPTIVRDTNQFQGNQFGFGFGGFQNGFNNPRSIFGQQFGQSRFNGQFGFGSNNFQQGNSPFQQGGGFGGFGGFGRGPGNFGFRGFRG